MRRVAITGLLSAALALGACREGAVHPVTALDRDTHQPNFPIASGDHGGVDCNACHGAFDTFRKFTCTASGCHTQDKVDPIHAGMGPDYRFEDTACLSCHPTGEAAMFDHPFPIDAASPHARRACAECHPVAADKKQFTCVACHEHEQPLMDGAHGSMAGYSYDSAACLSCHPKGEIPPFDHTRFPIGAGTTHPSRTCADCHKTTDRSQFDCLSCHEHAQPAMDGAHGAMADYGYESARCYQCHPDGQIPWFDHTRFPIGTGTTHPSRTCSDCHKTTDRTQFDCLGCHVQSVMDPWHAPVADYAYQNAKCYQCHPDGKVTGVDHSPYFPIATGAKHDGLHCSDCHTVPTNPKVQTCNVCHHTSAAMQIKHAGLVTDFNSSSPSCLRCHADSQVDRVSFHTANYYPPHRNAGCLQCHPSARADKPWGADFDKLDCLGCHPKADTDAHHVGRAGYAWDSLSCIKSGCHLRGAKSGGD